MFGLEMGVAVLLILCVFAVCAFEFVNGFHDTANAVATVIYTGSLKPQYAVVWSGICNFLGLVIGVGSGLKVAMGIVDLLPLADLANMPINENISLVLAIILSAIVWNLGTWYFGIPCSSSHTLIGSILGAGIAFYFMHEGVSNVNWGKAGEIGLSLLISPLFGFTLAVALMYIGRQVLKKERRKQIFSEPEPDSKPPTWIRYLLITTCTGVSFFHGSNDGQKGVGLMLIILMGFFPLQYALTPSYNDAEALASVTSIETSYLSQQRRDLLPKIETAKAAVNKHIKTPNKANKFEVRKAITKLSKGIKEEAGLLDSKLLSSSLKKEGKVLTHFVQLEPKDILWVMLMIAISIGMGTMIGWKRIVVTIGEKIGKRHMTYAEGAAAEITAAATIGLSTGLGMPVSTTHVLSSGVAGGMTASKGIKNLQPDTIRSMVMAWILTLPVTLFMSGLLYLLFRMF